ncbi:MAG TPA: lamin tail domain-containing protein [Vicinamibacterales bacterium]
MASIRRLAAGTVALICLSIAAPRDLFHTAQAVSSGLVISQIYGGGGNSGAPFTHDFVEIYNGGTAPLSLDGLSIQYTSATGAANFGSSSTQRTELPAVTLGPGAYFLVQEASNAAVGSPLPTPDHIDNDPIPMSATAGKVALVTGTDTLGCNGGSTPCDPAALARIIDLVGYGGANFFEGQQPTQAPSNTTAVVRTPGNVDTDENGTDFVVATPNPRNGGVIPPDPTPTTIHELQGDGPGSPFVGLDVVTTGIVTTRKTNGFFIQTPDGADDGRPETSEGVFVFTGTVPPQNVQLGDEVRVTGRVAEFKGSTAVQPGTLTEITGAAIETLSSGHALPAPLDLATLLPPPDVVIFESREEQFESFEGMLVGAPVMEVVAPTNGFGELSAVISGVARPFRQPGVDIAETLPGEAPATVPRFDGNFERVMLDSDDARFTVTPSNTVDQRFPLNLAAGAFFAPVTVHNVFGPLDYAFDNYRVVLDASATAAGGRLPSPVRAAIAGEFTIASLNLENFRDGTPNFAERMQKAARVIVEVLATPDVLGAIEVGDLDDLQQLAALVNAAAGTSYEAYLEDGDGQSTGFEQNIGYLVNRARIDVLGTEQVYRGKTFDFAGSTDLLHDRPPFILEARVIDTGTAVTVILNHLRSLIDVNSHELIGATGLTVGARVREKRRLQAEDLADLIAAHIDENLVVLGDMNAFEFNDGLVDVIGTLKGTPAPPDQVTEPSVDRWLHTLFDLADLLPPPFRYSYVFEGSAQVLDHMLINARMRDHLTLFAYARNNADFPESFEADFTVTTRISDHDAAVGYFRPRADVGVAATASSPAVAGSAVTLQVVAGNDGEGATNVRVSAVLPPGLTFQSATLPAGWACSTLGGTVTCQTGTLGAGQSVTLDITALLSCTVANATLLAVPVAIESDTADADTTNNMATASIEVANPAPAITDVSVSRSQLLFPSHRMVPVAVSYTASDACGLATSALRVTSDEPVLGAGQGLAGLTAPDWIVLGPHDVLLRAERSRRGDGRIYTITISATDEAGGTSTAHATVTVPRQ